MAQAIPKHRQLPSKEAGLFKEVLTHYELKQYKKGIKSADQILKKFPNHGETISLKALTLHSSLPFPPTATSQAKVEEAEAMARLGVKKDMQSHITWHVLGILAKTRRDWKEASMSFAMARKQDPDNIPVLRDAIALTTHTRQYQQALEARHHYLLLRPQIRSSWLGLMISHELVGDYEEAIRVYDGFQSTLSKDGASATEQAQTLMHVINLCLKAGKFEEAESKLEKGLKDGVISPRGEASAVRAKILVELSRKEDAEDAYRALLEQNPDNLEYYREFLRTRGLDITEPLDDASKEKVLRVLEQFGETYPKSSAPRRLALDVATGETFQKLARDYLIRGLERGVPSLFVDIKGVYRDSEKMAAVGTIMSDIIAQVKEGSSLHGDDTVSAPTTLLWAYYYLALHLTHPLHPSPDCARALELLDNALEHTPTLPEIYMAKAKVLKRAGDVQAAAEAMEDARLLDGQDRFLNGKAAKYWLRAGNVAKAEELLAMFTKKDMSAVQDLTDMQCLWFLQEEGDAHNRNGALAMALKRYQALVTVFQEYEDDQYDFHSYCMRRNTFTYYMALLKYEDQLRTHPAFFKTALSAIDIYLRISDDPSLTVEKLSPEEEAERKKAAKKAQKAEQKARKAAAASGEKKDETPAPDADPRGEALLKTETPLDDALKLWAPLQTHHKDKAETWLAGYELHIRKKLYLLALRDLRAAAAVDAEAPGLLPAIKSFYKAFEAAELSTPVEAAINQILPTLPTPTVEAYSSKSPAHILAAARAQQIAGASPAEAKATLVRLADAGSRAVETMREAVAFLSRWDKEEGILLGQELQKRLPLAFDFASPDDKSKRQAGKKAETKVESKSDV